MSPTLTSVAVRSVLLASCVRERLQTFSRCVFCVVGCHLVVSSCVMRSMDRLDGLAGSDKHAQTLLTHAGHQHHRPLRPRQSDGSCCPVRGRVDAGVHVRCCGCGEGVRPGSGEAIWAGPSRRKELVMFYPNNNLCGLDSVVIRCGFQSV